MEIKPEIVTIEIRQPNGLYKKEKFFRNAEYLKYIPIENNTLLPIDLFDINKLSEHGFIRNIEIIQKRFILWEH